MGKKRTRSTGSQTGFTPPNKTKSNMASPFQQQQQSFSQVLNQAHDTLHTSTPHNLSNRSVPIPPQYQHNPMNQTFECTSIPTDITYPAYHNSQPPFASQPFPVSTDSTLDDDHEDTEAVINNFIEKELEIPNADLIQFQNVHRLRKRRDGKPRNIIARFTNYRDHERVRKSVPNKLKSKPQFSVNQQYPTEISNRRKALIPKLKELQRRDKHIPLERYSQDRGRVNKYGNMLIEFCKRSGIYICNGRLFADKHIGCTTCKDASLVDYLIMSPCMFDITSDFGIVDFNPMFSDVHNRLYFSFSFSSSNSLNNSHNTINSNTYIRRKCTGKMSTPQTCFQHSSEEIRFFCEECHVFVCDDCVSGQGKHIRCKKIKLREYGNKNKNCLIGSVEEITSKKLPHIKRTLELAKNVKGSFNKSMDENIADVRSKTQMIKAIIDELQKENIRALEESRLKGNMKFDEFINYHQKRYSELTHITEEIQQQKSDILPSDVVKYDFELKKNLNIEHDSETIPKLEPSCFEIAQQYLEKEFYQDIFLCKHIPENEKTESCAHEMEKEERSSSPYYLEPVSHAKETNSDFTVNEKITTKNFEENSSDIYVSKSTVTGASASYNKELSYTIIKKV
ncbi:unnamed protein product [Mytilus edulis]|uniref:B box-type domain-containing protein n=1 Tax=Mytilus edulis TaxID=6550 RepID=A0A8S3RMY0_MYTED|nr:unnamed protein product [Mytilus edulis]